MGILNTPFPNQATALNALTTPWGGYGIRPYNDAGANFEQETEQFILDPTSNATLVGTAAYSGISAPTANINDRIFLGDIVRIVRAAAGVSTGLPTEWRKLRRVARAHPAAAATATSLQVFDLYGCVTGIQAVSPQGGLGQWANASWCSASVGGSPFLITVAPFRQGRRFAIKGQNTTTAAASQEFATSAQNVNIIYPTVGTNLQGDNTSGSGSGSFIGINEAGRAATANLPFKIVGLADMPNNDYGTNAIYVVECNQYASMPGAVGAS
jgi:hypothetical protein